MKFVENEPYRTKLIVGKYKYPCTITKKKDRLWFQFGFNKGLMAEVKMMAGAKWHGFEEIPIKQWSVEDNERNRFQISYLEGNNPYAIYDRELIPVKPSRNVYAHQGEILSHVITRRSSIVAAEMGTGKTLAIIEAMEWARDAGLADKWFYVAPKSALTSVQLEFDKWQSRVIPEFLTYDKLKTVVENWPPGVPPPQGVVYDESSRVKTPTSQRSKVAYYLANQIREHWGDNAFVILMSGSPAPKSPLDWWYQCEIACPGFLREGTYQKFRSNLALMSQGQTDAGQMFPKMITWLDDTTKCAVCGDVESEHALEVDDIDYHVFVPSVNEVERLYKRMNGLVIVKFKKDCLDLPEKQYRIVHCKPTQSTLNAAKLITASSSTVIKAMTLLRELSDGFQYEDVDVGMKECPGCNGTKTRSEHMYVGPDDLYEDAMDQAVTGQFGDYEKYFEERVVPCSLCSGVGEVVKYSREAVQVPCPKEDALREIIDQHDDVGRLVTYAGFTGSVERCVQVFLQEQWDVIRVDGRGWWSTIEGDPKTLLKIFQNSREMHPRIAFVAQPGAAGMGLTLTASPTIVYYSNDFNGESRIQSEDRIHRAGMDTNRAPTIIDLIHLQTDQLVLDNLQKKRELQQITMGEFKAAINNTEGTVER